MCSRILIEAPFGQTQQAMNVLLASKQLPRYLTDPIEEARRVANFAAHPSKSTNPAEIAEVKVGEPEWWLYALDVLFNYYFVQPAEAQRRRDALGLSSTWFENPVVAKP